MTEHSLERQRLAAAIRRSKKATAALDRVETAKRRLDDKF
jgi:hypothetical protein